MAFGQKARAAVGDPWRPYTTAALCAAGKLEFDDGETITDAAGDAAAGLVRMPPAQQAQLAGLISSTLEDIEQDNQPWAPTPASVTQHSPTIIDAICSVPV